MPIGSGRSGRGMFVPKALFITSTTNPLYLKTNRKPRSATMDTTSAARRFPLLSVLFM